jgi:proteasome accessory factor BC
VGIQYLLAEERNEVSSRTERLLDLLAVLEETGRPLTASEIRKRVPGYPEGEDAFRRAFERDKKALRDLGIEISVEAVPASIEGVGYRIKKSISAMPPISLRPEEAAAVAVALGAVALADEDSAQSRVLEELLYGSLKLGVEPMRGGSEALTAYVKVPVTVLESLVDAICHRNRVTFDYEKADGTVSRRVLEPHGLRYIKGFWYLAAEEPGSGLMKTFRVDRIRSDIDIDRSATFEARPIEQISNALSGPPWKMGSGDPKEVHIAVDPELAGMAQALFGEARSYEKDGEPVFVIEASWPSALVDTVLGFRASAEILSPPEVRKIISDRLERSIAWFEGCPKNAAKVAVEEAASLLKKSGGAGSRKSLRGEGSRSLEASAATSEGDGGRAAQAKRKREAIDRVRRLLVLIPWAMEHPGVKLSEICEKFSVTRSQLISDLQLLTLTGNYPYSPVDLVDLSWAEDRLLVSYAPHLSEFWRMTPSEAVAVVTALRAAQQLPGLRDNSSLESALAKIEEAVSMMNVDIDVVSEQLDPAVSSLLHKAIESGEALDIEYVSFSSERQTKRTIVPLNMFLFNGRWYLEAYCLLAEDIRIFRLSRILKAEIAQREDLTSSGSASDANELVDARSRDRAGQGALEKTGRAQGPGSDLFRDIAGQKVAVVAEPAISQWLFRVTRAKNVHQLPSGWNYGEFRSSTEKFAIRLLAGFAERVWIIEPSSLREAIAAQLREAAKRYASN